MRLIRALGVWGLLALPTAGCGWLHEDEQGTDPSCDVAWTLGGSGLEVLDVAESAPGSLVVLTAATADGEQRSTTVELLTLDASSGRVRHRLVLPALATPIVGSLMASSAGTVGSLLYEQGGMSDVL